MALSKIDESSWGGTQLGGRKNAVINGAMKISQRGNSFDKDSYTGGKFYSLDRFYFQGSVPSIDMTVEQSSDAPSATGLRNSIKVTIDSGNTSFPATTSQYFRFRHGIEAQDCTHLVEQPCTLTFWVKSSVTGQYDVALFAPDSGSNNHYVAPYTINTANTWEKKTLRVTGPSQINDDNGLGLDIQWQLSRAGTGYQTSSTNVWGQTKLSSSTSSDAFIKTTGATFFLTGVQLEKGDPTEFEHRSYGEELSLCQRFYEKIGIGSPAIANSTTGFWTGLTFKTAKRATPSVSLVSTTMRYYKFGVSNRDTTSANINGIYYNNNGMLVKVEGFSGLNANESTLLGGPNGNTEPDTFNIDADL